jgi:hypothetical protein
MKTIIQFPCKTCKNINPAEYWQIGMTLNCPNCKNPSLIEIPSPVSFQYETTYKDFQQILDNLHNYPEIKKFLFNNYDMTKLSPTNLHTAIQTNENAQRKIYNLRMDVER